MRIPWKRKVAGRATRARTAASPHARGRCGERCVARLLKRRGLRILARNWRFRGGEVDLVAAAGHELVLVEVKTRRPGACRELAPAQLQRLAHYAPRVTQAFGASAETPIRIDVLWVEIDSSGKPRIQEWLCGVDVETGEVRHLEAPVRSGWLRLRCRLRFRSPGSRFLK